MVKTKKKSSAHSKTRLLTFVGLMAALSTVIYYLFPEISLVPGVDYLKLDFSDIPALIAAVTLGPLSGIVVEVIKNVIHLLRTTTVGIGEIINVGIGAALVVSLSQFSKLFAHLLKKKPLSPSVYYFASVLTIGVTILAGWALNAIFTPVYFLIMGFPITSAGIFAGVWGSTLLNVVKAAFNLLPFFPVYVVLNKAFKKIYH